MTKSSSYSSGSFRRSVAHLGIVL